jgi:predicted ester cyclase
MVASSTLKLQELREALVREHIAAEKAHDIPRTIATFHHPRYEFIPFGSVSDGAQAVEELLSGLFASFPDFDIERPQLRHRERTVEVKAVVAGTRKHRFCGIPPTGRRIELPVCAILEFEDELLVGEKVYFDLVVFVRRLQT